MEKKSLLLLFIISVFTGCNILESEKGEVSATIDKEKVVITNESNNRIWFATFPTEMLPYINYALNSAELNQIKKGQTRTYYNESNLFGELITGEEMTVFYWSKVDPKDEDINSFTVTVK